MSATQRILEFAAEAHRLPGPVRDATLHLLADTLTVGAAGSTAPGAQEVLQAARSWGAGSDARVLARYVRLPAASAAFVNAFQIHCLEWDAVHEPAVVHALSVVTAAVHAAIDRQGGCDPEEALTALAVGVDVASGLGICARSPLRFFRPATAGALGAALAVARLARVTRFADVLGLAYSQCAGTMQAHVEGSIALPVQIAVAARSALTAVDLVQAGLTGPHDVLEGPFGYLRLIDEGELGAYAEQLALTWRIAEVSVKPFPSGRASHAALSTLDTLLREGRVSAATVSQIELHAPPLIVRLVGRPLVTGMLPAAARLCLPLLAALMLSDGCIDPRRFTPETFASPDIVQLAGRLRVVDDGNPDPNALSPQRLTVRLSDGSVVERSVPTTLGHPSAPLSAAQTAAKRQLARELCSPPDPRLFDDPLAYLTSP